MVGEVYCDPSVVEGAEGAEGAEDARQQEGTM